jgi:non-ribosomal peptide synthetase component E (peptide arylation enzyme)
MVRPKDVVAVWRHAEIATLVDIPRYRAATTPGKVAVLDTDRSLTYCELDQRSDLVAAAIASLGVAPGRESG